MAFPLWQLQQALMARLSGDGVLMAQVTGVYDHVPPGTVVPYVVFGALDSRTRTGQDLRVRDIRCTLHVWSEAEGKQQPMAILERLHALLHEAALTLTGGLSVPLCRVLNTRLLPPADTRREARMDLRVMVQG